MRPLRPLDPPHSCDVVPAACRRRAPFALAAAALLGCTGDAERRRVEAEYQAARDSAIAAERGAVTDRCVRGTPPAVTSTGLGPVRLGVTVRELARRCPVRDTAIALEGMPERASVVRLAGARVVVFTTGTRDTTVTRIVVADSVFRTELGIGIGATVGALRDAYGPLCTAAGDMGVVAGAPALPGVSFATSAALAAHAPGARDGGIPDTARITGLWVHGHAWECRPPA